MKKKFMMLAALSFGGATLFQSCLGGLGGGNGAFGSFWKGFFNEGWPSNNRWLNLAIDILNEELAG